MPRREGDRVRARSRTVLAVAVVVVLSVVVLRTALGEGRTRTDPAGDARRSSVLDIASVHHGDQGRLLVHRLTTHRAWRRALLAKGGEISFYFDTDGDAALERRLDVRYLRGRLAAIIKSSRGRVVGRGAVRRPDRRTVVVKFARSLLRPGLRRYRWFAFVGFRCHHRYKVCGDRAPSRGLITHRVSRKTAARRPGQPVGPGGRTSTTPVVPVHPAAIANLGYHLAFHDEFDTYDGGGWGQGRWWHPDNTPPGSIYAGDGALHLVSRRSDGYPDINTSTESDPTPAKFKRGYFEARMRWTGANGAWPGFWLSSFTHARNTHLPNPACPGPECLDAELDVFEGQGSEPNVYYGTLHRNSCTCYGGDETNSNAIQDAGLDLAADWHTYAASWTASAITWYLDGRPLMTAPTFDSTDQDMFLILQMWIGGWTKGTDASTPASVETQVDWVRVWQR
jgi:beta-glucanase (GH16 family)